MNQRDCVWIIRHPNYACKTRDPQASSRKPDHPIFLKDPSVGVRRHDYLLYNATFLRKTSCKFLLPPAPSSFSSVKVFYDCSGGNSRPSRPSGVGGGNFFADQNLSLSSCSCSCSRSCSTKLRRGGKRSTPNVQCSIQQSLANSPGRLRSRCSV